MFIEEKKVQTKTNTKQQQKKPQNQPLSSFQDFTKMTPWNLFYPNNKKDNDDCSFRKNGNSCKLHKKHKHGCKFDRAQHEHSLIINPTYLNIKKMPLHECGYNL